MNKRMLSKHLIVIYFVLGVTSKYLVEGLQCYVCEDCNEYEDFKELHICGEIGSTMKPIKLPELLEHNKATTTLKPAAEETEQYVDFYSEEKHDDNNTSSDKKKEESGSNLQSNTENHTETIKKRTTTSTTKNPTTTPTPTKKKEENSTKSFADQPTTLKQKETSSVPISTPSPSNVPTTRTPETTSINSKPIQLPDDYDDYLEYDIPSDNTRQVKIKSNSSPTSLLKINEPVCYMIKFHVNNTVITNRGCTTFINANKQLTCQSLYNGAPMEKCLVCSNDGCNKFLSDYSYEDDGSLLINAGGLMEKLEIFVILILAITNLIVV